MKKVISFLFISTFTLGALGQGLVNFLNNSTTLISYRDTGQPIPSGIGGTYRFALLSAPSGTTDAHQFTFTGVYATNQNVAGRIAGGVGLQLSGWAPGETRAFLIVGWDATVAGPTFNPAWMLPGYYFTESGFFQGPAAGRFGVSAIAPAGVAGGGPQSLPNLVVFGGSQGIPDGFLIGVPEPAALAFFGIIAGAIWIFRRRS